MMKFMKISTKDICRFRDDGVISLGQVLSQEELPVYRAALEGLFFSPDGVVSQKIRDLSEIKGKSPANSVMQLVNAYSLSEVFYKLVHRKDLLKVVSNFLGKEIQLFRDQAFYKMPLSDSEIYMHQDNRYWHLDPPSAVTLWIALDDSTIENGCVHFIKGSHLLGRVNHAQARDGRSVLLEADAAKSSSIPFEVPAGHATLHHCQTLHWSPSNQSKFARRAYSIQYMSTGLSRRGEDTNNFPVVYSNGQ